jgi:subtilase family serine protease
MNEKHTSNLKHSDIAKFDVNVSNEGFMPATNVTVNLTIDGMLIDSEVLERVHLSRCQRVVFTWTAREGEHLVRIIVDPEELIPEISEENNIKEFKLRVGAKSTSLIPGYELAFALIALFLAFIILSAHRRYLK